MRSRCAHIDAIDYYENELRKLNEKHSELSAQPEEFVGVGKTQN